MKHALTWPILTIRYPREIILALFVERLISKVSVLLVKRHRQSSRQHSKKLIWLKIILVILKMKSPRPKTRTITFRKSSICPQKKLNLSVCISGPGENHTFLSHAFRDWLICWILSAYHCALERSIKVHGRVYMTPNYLCFRSKIAGAPVVRAWTRVHYID